MTKIKKRYSIAGIFLLVLFGFLFFLSTIIRSYVTNNSKELLGRQVDIGELHINYLRVAVQINDLVMYEANAIDTFSGFKEFYLNFEPWKLLQNEYAVKKISLDSLYVYIEQEGDQFNFGDLIPEADTSKVDSLVETTNDPVRFLVENISLSRSTIHFYDKTIDNRLLFDNLNLNLPVIAWNSEQSEVGAEFQFGERGTVFIGAEVDHQTNRYAINLRTEDMELQPVSNYLKEYMNTGGISGLLQSNLVINGSMDQVTDIVVTGATHLDTFKLWTPEKENVLTFDRLSVELDSIDLGQSYFGISTVRLNQPVLVARLDKEMSNLERLFLPIMESTSDSTLQVDSASESDSMVVNYKLDSLIVQNALVAFHDNTLNRPFQYDFKDIDVDLLQLSANNDSIPVQFSINMNDQGRLSGRTIFSMIDPLHINLDAELERLRLMSFSPYSEYYIARPITQGDFNYHLTIAMNKARMVNENKIRINELDFGDKTGDTTATKAPVRLGLYLLKDPNDVIAIDLPVTGNPSDPDFSVSKIIWKSLSNLVVKAAASPFNALGSLVGTRAEDLEVLPLAYAQDSLGISQRETLSKIGEIINRKPQLVFELVQETDPVKEKAHLAVQMAKEKMLLDKTNLQNAEDTARFKTTLSLLSNDDEQFLHYLNNNVSGADTLGVTQASEQLIGSDALNTHFNQLLDNRNQLIMDFMLEEMQIDSTSVEVRTADLRNIPEELKSP